MPFGKDHQLIPPVMTSDGRCLSFLETGLDYLNLVLRRSEAITPEVMNAHSAITSVIENGQAGLVSDCRAMLVDALRAIGRLDE
ncbi:MAG: hypothetical protein HYU58_12735 [Proteobacteria bacterium]|nr:hypothetical protein [Pseudomonadota bacterium]